MNKVYLPTYEYQGAFLQEWPDRRDRGRVSHYFFKPINDGVTDPTQAVSETVALALDRLSQSEPKSLRAQVLRKMLQQIRHDPTEAVRFSAFLIERQSWPAERKQQLRAEREVFYQDLLVAKMDRQVANRTRIPKRQLA